MATVSPHELLARLAKGKPIPGILLVGADSYLARLVPQENSSTHMWPKERAIGASGNFPPMTMTFPRFWGRRRRCPCSRRSK